MRQLATIRNFSLIVFAVVLVGGAILGPGRERPGAARSAAIEAPAEAS